MGSDPKRWASRPGAASLQAHGEECGGSRSITEWPPNREQSANFEAGAMMWGIRNSAKARVGHVSDAFHAARSRDDRARPRANRCNPIQYCIGGNMWDDTSPRPCLPNQSLLFVLRSRTVHDRMAPHHDLKTSRRCFINASHIRSLLEVHTACF